MQNFETKPGVQIIKQMKEIINVLQNHRTTVS